VRGTAEALGRQCECARDVGASDEVMVKNNGVFGLCKVFLWVHERKKETRSCGIPCAGQTRGINESNGWIEVNSCDGFHIGERKKLC